MIQAYQFRFDTGIYGTFSEFYIPGKGWSSFVAEPPWKDNRRDVSCIPAGEYIVRPRKSPKYGWSYHITDVPNRSYVLLHSGNLAGDIEKGMMTHTKACHLHGQKMGWISGQKAVLNSRATINALQRLLDLQPFKLLILWL